MTRQSSSSRDIAVNKRVKPTLEELLAATPPEAFHPDEMIKWERAPAVGREWPNKGWDELPNGRIEAVNLTR